MDRIHSILRPIFRKPIQIRVPATKAIISLSAAHTGQKTRDGGIHHGFLSGMCKSLGGRTTRPVSCEG